MTSPVVSAAQLREQLEAGSVPRSNGCSTWLDPQISIISSIGLVSAQRASAYLNEGEWADRIWTTCDLADCLTHVTSSEAKAKAAADERAMALVASHTQAATLADLYRRAKKKGLLVARQEY